jgi:hypothetical protein
MERLLVAARPVPSERFVERTERRLLGRRQRHRWHRPQRGLGAMMAAVAGVATAIVIVTLAGTGPLASGGNDEVKAKDDCRYVAVTRTVPRPVVTTHNGALQLSMVPERRIVRVKRCG